jgi:hypothetical protein
MLLIALGPVLLSGCSYLFVEAPPEGHERMRHFDCTSSRLAPIVDTAFAGMYGLSGVVYGAAAAQSRGSTYGRAPTSVAVGMLAIAAVDAASAAHGYSTTSECRRAKRDLNERLLSMPPSGCGSDAECKGERICEAGLCVAPRTEPAPSTELPTLDVAPPASL